VPDVTNPRGSGYYAVVMIELAPHSSLYKDFRLRMVIPCKEQLLNRYASERVEAWPLDALMIVPAAQAASGHFGSIPEGVSRRNGLWAPVDDEIAENADRAEEEECVDPSGYSEYRGDYHQELWGLDRATFDHDADSSQERTESWSDYQAKHEMNYWGPY
jgi:hypothetical protein